MRKGFLLLLIALLAAASAEANDACQADFDGNGVVDFADFLLFNGLYGQSGGETCAMTVDADSLAVVTALRDSIVALQATLGATRFAVVQLQNTLASETERANENQRLLTASNDAFNSLAQTRCPESEPAAQPEPEPPVVIETPPQTEPSPPEPPPEPEPALEPPVVIETPPEPEPQPEPVKTRTDSAKLAYEAFIEGVTTGTGNARSNNPRGCTWVDQDEDGNPIPNARHMGWGWDWLKPEVQRAWENGIWGAADYNGAHEHNGGRLFNPWDSLGKKRLIGFLWRFLDTRKDGYNHTCQWGMTRNNFDFRYIHPEVKTGLEAALNAVFGAG